MKNYFLLGLLTTAFIACKPDEKKKSDYNFTIPKLIFSNTVLKNKFNDIFDHGNSRNSVFKLLISRRNNFVRITIYKLLNKREISEYPSSYFIQDTQLFLCYDGSETLYGKKINSVFIDSVKKILKSNLINDSRVFQFDIDYRKNIKLNIPAINPYDLDESIDTMSFKKKN